MEPSTELLELLREIRDAQREALAMTKAWMEQSDQKYLAWQKQLAEYKAERDQKYPAWQKQLAEYKAEREAFKERSESDRLKYLKANALYVQQAENYLRQQRQAKRIGLVVLGIMLLGALTLGILAALGLLK